MVVFITGSTGFIGRRVAKQLLTAGHRVRALCRHPDPALAADWIAGDLERTASYRPALDGVEAVIHLGGLQGKALAARHDRVNRTATCSLHDAAREAGVRRFIFASTVAVRYPEKAKHAYARAKEAAEKTLRTGRPATVVVRPTLVLGANSAVGHRLARLAHLPLPPVFGSGRVRVQPVHVDDAAEAFVDVATSPEIECETIELGGPEQLTLDELIKRFRIAAGLRPRPIAHLPIGLTSSVLDLLEPAFFSVLPFTSGQLDAFRYDSVAERSAFMEARKGRMRTVDDMVRDTLAS